MIRHATAFAVAASLGSVVGTVVGCVFGVAVMSIAYSNSKASVVNNSMAWPKTEPVEPVTEEGSSRDA